MTLNAKEIEAIRKRAEEAAGLPFYAWSVTELVEEDVPKLLAAIERLKSSNYVAVSFIESICEMICISLSHGVSMDIGGIGSKLEEIREVLLDD